MSGSTKSVISVQRKRSIFHRNHRKTPSSPAKLLLHPPRSASEGEFCDPRTRVDASPPVRVVDWWAEEQITPFVVNRRRSTVDHNTSAGSGSLRRGRPNALSSGLPSPAQRRSLDTTAPATVVSTTDFISPEKQAVVLKGASTVDTSPIRGPDELRLKRQESTLSVGSINQTEDELENAFIQWHDMEENEGRPPDLLLDLPEKRDTGGRSVSCSGAENKPEFSTKPSRGHASLASLDSGVDCQSAHSVNICTSSYSLAGLKYSELANQQPLADRVVIGGNSEPVVKLNFGENVTSEESSLMIPNTGLLESVIDCSFHSSEPEEDKLPKDLVKESVSTSVKDGSFVKEMTSVWDSKSKGSDRLKGNQSPYRFARSPLRNRNISPVTIPPVFSFSQELNDMQMNRSASQRRPQLPIGTGLVHAESVQQARRLLSQDGDEDTMPPSLFTAMAGHTPARSLLSSHHRSTLATESPPRYGTPKIKPSLLTPASMKPRKTARSVTHGPQKPVKRLQRNSPKSPHRAASVRVIRDKGRLSPLPSNLNNECQF